MAVATARGCRRDGGGRGRCRPEVRDRPRVHATRREMGGERLATSRGPGGPESDLIGRRFEDRANAAAGTLACGDVPGGVTYGQVNGSANRLARRLLDDRGGG